MEMPWWNKGSAQVSSLGQAVSVAISLVRPKASVGQSEWAYGLGRVVALSLLKGQKPTALEALGPGGQWLKRLYPRGNYLPELGEISF